MEPHGSPLENASSTLRVALEKHAISLADEQVDRLDEYCRLLWQVNQHLNLTRHTDYDRFVARDVIDTIQLAHLLREGEQVLDVGTGGGVPGIPLAILRPDLELSLCESVGKKAQAVNRMVSELGLPLTVFECRAEHLLDDFRFQTLVARAVGPMWKMLKWFADQWPAIGRLLAIKGPGWIDERQEARHRGLLKELNLRKLVSYPLVGTESESVILQIWPKEIEDPSLPDQPEAVD